MTNLGDPRTRLVRLVQALDRTAAEVAPGRRDAGLAVRATSTRRSAPSTASRADYQASIDGAPGGAGRRDRGPARRSARSWPTATGLFRELRPGIRALRTAAPDLADAFELGTGSLRRVGRLQPAPEAHVRGAAALRRGPARRARRPRPDEPVADPRADGRAPRAGPDASATTSPCGSATSGRCCREGDTNGTSQRFIIIAAPSGPNNEGGPASAPANGPATDNYLHANPYPNTGVARARPRSARRPTRPTPTGRRSSATCPATRARATTRP